MCKSSSTFGEDIIPFNNIPTSEDRPKAILSFLHESPSPIGLVTLRRRASVALDRDVYDMLVDDELMMSDVAHVSEDALADWSLNWLSGNNLSVLIGGLGFGFTAIRALANPHVTHVTVVERLKPVIDWHRQGLLPWSADFINDPKLTVVEDDFFYLLVRPEYRTQMYDAILLDIDDSPERVWHPDHAGFYSAEGLAAAAQRIETDGILAIWFATRPADGFIHEMDKVFNSVCLEPVVYADPCLNMEQQNYLLTGRAK
jgi:spermidine synthase